MDYKNECMDMISGENQGDKSVVVSRHCTWKDSLDNGLVFGKPNTMKQHYFFIERVDGRIEGSKMVSYVYACSKRKKLK